MLVGHLEQAGQQPAEQLGGGLPTLGDEQGQVGGDLVVA
jgi:hypothetical protein